MKLFHISDLHLGKRIYEFSMLEEQRELLLEILRSIDEEQPQALLISGDIYDKPVPPTEAVRLLDDFLTASNLAGIAFGNAGTGAVHAMSYPLSGVYHVTHGEANYQFLTAVFAKYQELDPDGRIKELNSFLSNVLECDADLVYVEIGKLLDQIIARKPLHEYGMREEEIESFAKTVEETQQRLLNQSYVKLTWQQMAEIYKELY